MQRCVLAVVCVTTVMGCSESGRPIEYVIPDGYRGKVWVLLDPNAPNLPVIGGRYQVEFPAQGLLRVRSMQPFERWHGSSARFAGGTGLAVDLVPGQSTVSPFTIAMWSLARGSTWPNQRDYIAWVVGTEAEAGAIGLDQYRPPVAR